MITSNGKLQIKRFVSKQVNEIASYISLGTGTTAASINDTKLAFEVARIPVLSISVDPNSDKVVFRGNLPPGNINTAYEIGLWAATPVETSRTLNLIGSSVPVTWTNGTLTSVNSRANTNTLKIDYVGNGTTNSELVGIYEDLSMYRDVDSLAVAYYAGSNLSSVRVRLGYDATNYFEFLLPAPTANSYNIARLNRSTATKVGSPTWGVISYVAVRPSATAAGPGSIYLDGIRFESNPLDNSNVLVARSVLATPKVIDPDIDSDIEYSVVVTIA